MTGSWNLTRACWVPPHFHTIPVFYKKFSLLIELPNILLFDSPKQICSKAVFLSIHFSYCTNFVENICLLSWLSSSVPRRNVKAFHRQKYYVCWCFVAWQLTVHQTIITLQNRKINYKYSLVYLYVFPWYTPNTQAHRGFFINNSMEQSPSWEATSS